MSSLGRIPPRDQGLWITGTSTGTALLAAGHRSGWTLRARASHPAPCTREQLTKSNQIKCIFASQTRRFTERPGGDKSKPDKPV